MGAPVLRGYVGQTPPNIALEPTPSSVRSCLAVRRDSSNRIPENRVGNRRNVPKVSRLTGAETGRRDQSMAAQQERRRREGADIADLQDLHGMVKSGLIEAQFPVGPHETHRQSA